MSTRVSLGSNLPQNLFNMSGDMTWDTCPFYFMALQRGCSYAPSTATAGQTTGLPATVPGYFFVTYTYDLKNPIGSSWTYSADGLVRASTVGEGFNVSGVIIEE